MSKGSYWCAVCHLELRNIKDFKAHIRGRKHLQRIDKCRETAGAESTGSQTFSDGQLFMQPFAAPKLQPDPSHCASDAVQSDECNLTMAHSGPRAAVGEANSIGAATAGASAAFLCSRPFTKLLSLTPTGVR